MREKSWFLVEIDGHNIMILSGVFQSYEEARELYDKMSNHRTNLEIAETVYG